MKRRNARIEKATAAEIHAKTKRRVQLGSNVFRASVFALCSLSLGISVGMYFVNRSWFYLSLPIAAVCVAFALVALFLFDRNVHRYLSHISDELNLAERKALYNYPQPVFVINSDRVIVWYNELFLTQVFNDVEAYGVSMDVITGAPLDRLHSPEGVEIEYNSKFYTLYARLLADDAKGLTILYLVDCTKLRLLRREHKLCKPTVVLIMIDNYDDMMQNARESEKAQIAGRLDKLLEDFIGQTTGILRRVSNDRFIAIIEERHLQDMIETRFSILDNARAITVGERLCVTLSIGVGREAKTLAECEVQAKQALDMSLGRGGDQAAIKTSTGFDFFGGTSKGIEKHAKVKTRIIATALSELISVSTRVIIMGHRFGDLDCLGASIGLARVIRNMGKDAYIAVDQQHNLAASLIKRMIDSGSADFFMVPEVACELVNKDSLLIIVDTHNPAFLESHELYSRCERVVVIDHHRKMVTHIENAVIFHHEPFASSASEMVTELIQYFGDSGRISTIEAEALLAGIMLDTKNFVMRTGVRTFEAAAFLRRQGADTIAVRALFSNSMESYQRKMRLVSSTDIYRKCAVCCSDFQSDDLQMVAPQAADELLGISGVESSFVLYEENNVVHISARSLGKMNVQLIMEQLGGGGHQTMAGAQLQGASLEGVRRSLREAIDNYYEKNKQIT